MAKLAPRSPVCCAFFTMGCAAALSNTHLHHLRDEIAVDTIVHDDDLSFWDVPYRENASIDVTPPERDDGLIVGELGVDGGDRDIISKLAAEIADGEHGNYDSLLIAHKNRLLFESYYLRGRINLTHPQVSVTKAYTSLVVGRAIQLGFLTMADLEKPLISFLGDLAPEHLAEGARRVTLHQAMTMRSGIRITDERRAEYEKKLNELQGQGLAQAYFENSDPITLKDQKFRYQHTDPNLVMQVVNAVVPGPADAFIRTELFEKMGITTYSWQTNLSGLPNASSRTSLTSRAMMKVGILVRNNGKWQGEQLVSAEFIAKSIDRIFLTTDEDVFGGGKDVSNQGYGYFWWSGDLKHGGEHYFSSSAQGGRGQFIILIDELDLIVVATAHEKDVKTLQMVAERIVPAFVLNPSRGGQGYQRSLLNVGQFHM